MAASKKPAANAAKKTAPKQEKVTLTPAERDKRKRKALFFELIEHGLSVPKALRDEFAPTDEDDAPAPAATQAEDQPRTIRNLRSIPVHMRLDSGTDKPYRVALEPRGQKGDVAKVPARCTDDTAFSESFNAGLFEIITSAERASIDYSKPADRRAITDPRTGLPVQVLPTEGSEDNTVAEYAIQTQHHGQRAGEVTRTDVNPRQVYVPGSHPADASAELLKPAEGLAEGSLANGGVGGSTAMPGTLPVVVRD
jgi:hypothetical protein